MSRRILKKSGQLKTFNRLPQVATILRDLRTGEGAVRLPSSITRVSLSITDAFGPKDEGDEHQDVNGENGAAVVNAESVDIPDLTGSKLFWREHLKRLSFNNQHVYFSVADSGNDGGEYIEVEFDNGQDSRNLNIDISGIQSPSSIYLKFLDSIKGGCETNQNLIESAQ